MISIVAIVLVVLSSTVLGAFSMRYSRTTSDFLVASRTVSPRMNAAAVCGEYLSAGTFLGLAGLVMVSGLDMLWYPVGYTAGYVALLVLVAAPLRRFGSYTIPEFAEGRLESTSIRRLAAVFVLVISFLYLLPQMKGAGISLRTLTGAPYWAGVVTVAVAVGLNVAIGGMRGVTHVQAFQYVVKLIALGVAAVILWAVTTRAPGPSAFANSAPILARETTFTLRSGSTLQLEKPTFVTMDGTVDGKRRQGRINLDAGLHLFSAGSQVTLNAGVAVPQTRSPFVQGKDWSESFRKGSGRDHPLYLGLSLIVATVLGTMGLPHIVTRFYTNPNGTATRRTIVVVIVLLGAYYVWPVVLGVLGRRWAPDLLQSGGTDAVVLMLPERVLGPGLQARLLTGLLAGGAFAAFLSTSTGLIVAVAGAVSHDLVGGGVRRFRQAALLAALVSALLGLGVRSFGINVLVGWAFAVAASSFSPLLVLGVWWPRFTSVGAACGLIIGGGAASIAIGATMLGLTSGGGWLAAMCAQPAAWSVPLGIAGCIVGSLATQHRRPKQVASYLSRMHTPERIRP
jgi:Na+(H+)/acetate symporter ActP